MLSDGLLIGTIGTIGTIGVRLGLAPKAVTDHASAIYAKLHILNRAEAVERARRADIG